MYSFRKWVQYWQYISHFNCCSQWEHVKMHHVPSLYFKHWCQKSVTCIRNVLLASEKLYWHLINLINYWHYHIIYVYNIRIGRMLYWAILNSLASENNGWGQYNTILVSIPSTTFLYRNHYIYLSGQCSTLSLAIKLTIILPEEVYIYMPSSIKLVNWSSSL